MFHHALDQRFFTREVVVKSAVVYIRCCSYLPYSKTFQAVIGNEPVGNFHQFAFAVSGSRLLFAPCSAGIPFHKFSLPQTDRFCQPVDRKIDNRRRS